MRLPVQSEQIHREFIVDVVAQKMLHEIDQFDICLKDKVAALRMVISMLLKNSIRII